jgi:tetratricopeptide (TPR) repeat protein
MRSNLLYIESREDSAVAVLRELQRDRSAYYRAVAAYSLADLAMLHGRLGDWGAMRTQAHGADEERGAPAAPLLDSLVSARADVWFRERSTRGIRLLDSTLAREPPPVLQSPVPGPPQSGLQQPYLEAALTYALARAPERARALLARYDAQVRDSTLRRFFEPRRHDALAEIALAEGRPLDAAREFRLGDVRSDGPVNGCAICLYVRLGRAYDLAEMPDSTIAMFERYLATPFFGRLRQDAWFLAGVLKRLGELYEARGDHARAASYYARFVDLWKDADPELQPKVADVRRRLARLRGTER